MVDLWSWWLQYYAMHSKRPNSNPLCLMEAETKYSGFPIHSTNAGERWEISLIMDFDQLYFGATKAAMLAQWLMYIPGSVCSQLACPVCTCM